MRELFYDRNPGDARVKVGSDRKVFSRQRRPSFGLEKIGYFSRAFCPRGPSKIGPSIGRSTPKKLLEGTRAKRQSSSRVRELCFKSDAQLLSTIAHRSLVFLGAIFVLGHPKPSRNRPETARHSGVPGCVQILLTMELKDNSKCRVPGCIQLRPGPGLKIDTF